MKDIIRKESPKDTESINFIVEKQFMKVISKRV